MSVRLTEVKIEPLTIDSFASIVSDAEFAAAQNAAAAARERLAGRVVWNVNSTAVGGGVAEMSATRCCLRAQPRHRHALARDPGRPGLLPRHEALHHALHGRGDGSARRPRPIAVYEARLGERARARTLVRPGDVVILHDPQTAGLAPALLRSGARVIWRCHIGPTNPTTSRARLGVPRAAISEDVRYVFSREAYVPARCDHGKA